MTVYEKDRKLTSYFNIYLDGKLAEHILFQNTYENSEDPIPPEEPKEDPEDPKDDPVSMTRYMYMMIASLAVVMVILYQRRRRERI